VRVSVKAVIIRDGRLLVNRCRHKDGSPFYILPGGGQEAGETLHDALRRECLEEIGCPVTPGRLLFVRDYLGVLHKQPDKSAQQVEVMFAADVAAGKTPRVGESPDEYQDGVEWLPLERLAECEFYPLGLRERIAALSKEMGGAYVGAID
jgi:ADP-ribose pyrophosphatase YjhB (NUDIX family)